MPESQLRIAYKIPPTQAKEILLDCFKLAYRIKADQLNASISFQRKPTKKNPLEVFDMALKDPKASNFTFIRRDMSQFGARSYFDVGCNVHSGSTTFFLWLDLDLSDGEVIIGKYKLKPTHEPEGKVATELWY